MVMVDDHDSLFLQMRSTYRFVVIYGNVIVFVALLSVCIYCFKRKSASGCAEDDSDCERDGPLGSDASTPLMSGEEKVKMPNLLSPNDLVTFNLQPATPQPYRKSIDSRSPSIFTPFQKISIQPEYENLLPFALPEMIPDAPTGLTEDLGTIYFSISYDVFGLVLKILIQKAENLQAKDLFGTSDPYVKVHLHPATKVQKLTTKIRMKNLNPVWNEVFTFEDFPHDKLLQKSLYLQVFDFDRFTRDDELGETEIALGNIRLQEEPVDFIKKLRPCKHSRGYLGDLLVSMCYSPSLMRITIIVMKCSRLKSMDVTGKTDAYVKIYLLHEGKRMEQKKTQVQKRQLNPVWNEVFEFEIPVDRIRGTSFAFTIKDHDVILPNRLIGKVVTGHLSSGSSSKHWTDMLSSPRKAIAMWHTITK